MLIDRQNFELIDLTHFLSPESPCWFGTNGFSIKPLTTFEKNGYLELEYHFSFAGVGTHMDAPLHFCPKGKAIADIPLESLIGNAHVIDVSKKASAEYLVTVDDIKNHEMKYSPIEENEIVLIYTGWSKYWDQPQKYINKNPQGKRIFPSLDAKAGMYLAKKGIKGLGIDTLSPDLEDSGFPNHKTLLGKGIYLLENLTNLDQLPATGALCIALPPKIAGGTESTLRVIGLVAQKNSNSK